MNVYLLLLYFSKFLASDHVTLEISPLLSSDTCITVTILNKSTDTLFIPISYYYEEVHSDSLLRSFTNAVHKGVPITVVQNKLRKKRHVVTFDSTFIAKTVTILPYSSYTHKISMRVLGYMHIERNKKYSIKYILYPNSNVTKYYPYCFNETLSVSAEVQLQ
jgi:hypothetical protein